MLSGHTLSAIPTEETVYIQLPARHPSEAPPCGSPKVPPPPPLGLSPSTQFRVLQDQPSSKGSQTPGTTGPSPASERITKPSQLRLLKASAPLLHPRPTAHHGACVPPQRPSSQSPCIFLPTTPTLLAKYPTPVSQHPQDAADFSGPASPAFSSPILPHSPSCSPAAATLAFPSSPWDLPSPFCHRGFAHPLPSVWTTFPSSH